MIKFIKDLQDIVSFTVSKVFLVYENSKNEIFIYKEDDSKFLFQAKNKLGLNIYENFLVTSDNSNEVGNFIYDLNTLQNKIDFNDIDSSFVYPKCNLKIGLIKLKNGSLLKYDFSALRKLNLIDGEFSLIHFIHGENCYLTSRIKPILIKHINDVISWQTDLSPYGKIINILGVINELLWLTVEKEIGNHQLIALNEQNGELVYHLVNIDGLHIHSCLLNVENGMIYSMNQQGNTSIILHINANNGIVEKQYELPALHDKGFRVGTFNNHLTMHKNELYFAIERLNVLFNVGVAVLDINTSSLLWASVIENRKGTITQKVQVTDDKMYVLDNGGVLHIYQKQK